MKSKIIRGTIILVLFFVALWAPKFLAKTFSSPQTRVIHLTAQRYAYTPGRIFVNQGDTVIIKPSSKDVTHGFYLDGYPVEFIFKKGNYAFQKYAWKDDDGKTHVDWDKVSQIKFVASKAGRFDFRCTQVCGNLHPFMTGELIVAPNDLYHSMIGLSFWLVISLIIWFRFDGPPRKKKPLSINLLEVVPGLKWLFKRRSLQFFLLFPGFVIFYVFILASLKGSPVGSHNVSIIIVWILWWFLLKAVFVPLGARLWCMICPLPGPAEWLSRKAFTAVHFIQKPLRGRHHKFIGLNRDWPKPLRNMWLQNILFLLLISFGIILITRPLATSVVFLLIFLATILLAFIFRNRVFCLHLCPVGGFLGNYSMASTTALRVIDPEVCKAHKHKSCTQGSQDGWGCPWNQYPGTMDRNNYCGICTECVKTCTKDNVGFFLRPFGSDRVVKNYSEMYNIMIMLVVALAFSVTMLGPWGFIKNAANVTESHDISGFLTYIGVVYTLSLVVFPGVFAFLSWVSAKLSGYQGSTKLLTLRLSYMLIPVGIFAWIAFSLPSIMVNYTYILNVLSDPFGYGWNLFGTAGIHFHPFHPEFLPLIQGLLLLTGLYFGIHRTHLALGQLIPDGKKRLRALVLPSLFALVVVNIFLKLYMG
ncbi:MAG TPA: 4Fe-4S binding protein [Desulfuromonadales bacterium]|nr:4Fe-4S binding protein [Desulfuromonadales bacterium]